MVSLLRFKYISLQQRETSLSQDELHVQTDFYEHYETVRTLFRSIFSGNCSTTHQQHHNYHQQLSAAHTGCVRMLFSCFQPLSLYDLVGLALLQHTGDAWSTLHCGTKLPL